MSYASAAAKSTSAVKQLLMSPEEESMFNERCYSVARYLGQSYVGTKDGIYSVADVQGAEEELVRGNMGQVKCIRFHKNLMLRLICVHGENEAWKWLVSVREMNSGRVKTWLHNDLTSKPIANKLTVLDDKIYVPNRSKGNITVYSLNGIRLSHIVCFFYNDELTSIASTHMGNLVVTQRESNVVKCINPTEKGIVWTSNLTQPTAVAIDPQTKMVQVATEFRRTKYVKSLLPLNGQEALDIFLPGLDSQPVADICFTEEGTIYMIKFATDKLLRYHILPTN